MSDPIFLRNLISGSVYAEQMNSAQIQGQQAANERAAKLRREKFLEEQAAVAKAAESGKSGIEEREGRHSREQPEANGDVADRDDETDPRNATGEEVRHIDLTA